MQLSCFCNIVAFGVKSTVFGDNDNFSHLHSILMTTFVIYLNCSLRPLILRYLHELPAIC